jgi:hypothetical protein
VVGSSVSVDNCFISDSGRAFLWEDGDMLDLNAFVPPGSDLALTQGAFINDRGEILASGVLLSGDSRSVLLIPCDDEHPGIQGCDYGPLDPSTVKTRTLPPSIGSVVTRQFHNQLVSPFPIRGQSAGRH